MIDLGLPKCKCVKDTTVDGIQVGKTYYYDYSPHYELNPSNRTYVIFYNDGKESLHCTGEYFLEYFSEIKRRRRK